MRWQTRHILSQAAVTLANRCDSSSACLRNPNHYITIHPSVSVQQTQDEIKEIKAALSSYYKQTTNCCHRSLVAPATGNVEDTNIGRRLEGTFLSEREIISHQRVNTEDVSLIFDANGKRKKKISVHSSYLSLSHTHI